MKGNHFDNSVLVRSAVTSVGLSAAEKDAEFQTPLKLSKARREYFAIIDFIIRESPLLISGDNSQNSLSQ